MERRHFIYQPQMTDMGPNHMWNHQHPNGPQMNLADGSSMRPYHNVPSQNSSVVSYTGTTMRVSSDIPLPNHSSGSVNYMANSTKNSYDSYVCPSSSSSNWIPPYYVQNGPCYNQVIVSDTTALSYPQMDYGRATYKRKIPSVPDAERSILTGYYGAGSSSGLPSQAGHVEPKPMVGHGYWTMDPASAARSYRGNDLFISEDASQRNVRSRHGNGLHLETTSNAVSSSSYMPHHFPPVINTVNPTASGQLNHNPVALDNHAIRNSSDLVSFDRGMHHPNRGSHGPNVNMGYGPNQNAVLGRTICHSLPHPHDTAAQSSAMVHTSSNQRTSYRTPLNYPAAGFTTNAQDFRVAAGVTAMPPRYPRNLSILGNVNEGSRARNQFHIFSNAGDTPARWAYGGAAIADQASLYSSMNYFDQHNDMRLDIDNMSYEELLALGERIGNVNTGLTEEAMSSYLVESIYCSSNLMQDDQDKENCAICLEPYEDRECLGKLNCRHKFHDVCIRKWLSIKNACPICKASASEDM